VPEDTVMNTLKESIQEIEKKEIINALKESDWIMTRAALKLGLTDRIIGYKARKYGIKREIVFRLS
jgi:transcriptional regulator with GAF, ATPase, and Fis domain